MEPLAILSLICGLFVFIAAMIIGYGGVLALFLLKRMRPLGLSVCLAGAVTAVVCALYSVPFHVDLTSHGTDWVGVVIGMVKALPIGFGLGSAVGIAIGLPVFLLYRLIYRSVRRRQEER